MLCEAVRVGLGYDDFGNSRDLLTIADRRNIDQGRYVRASGEATCPGCNETFNLHPQVQGALWLRRGCFNLVKL